MIASRAPFLFVVAGLGCAALAGASSARLYKSGPIQITADGAVVWTVNPDHDSVSRLDTATELVTEVPLPDPGDRHRPLGLAVSDDGAEVWVACHDSDRVYVLRGSDGAQLARIELPWGTGPYSVALAPPDTEGAQSHALVTGFRNGRVFWLEAAGKLVAESFDVYASPLGVAFTDDDAAWITHLFADGEQPRISRLDVSDRTAPRVTTENQLRIVRPQHSGDTVPHQAEGGYLVLRGHPAQVPEGADGGRLWLPVQYENIQNGAPHPDAAIQSTIRKVDLETRVMASGSNQPSNSAHPAKIILTAVAVHDPTTGPLNPIYDGPGWDARVAGPVDLAFSADGQVAYLLHENSDDVLVVPTSTPPVRPAGAPALVEIGVGERPIGIVASPASDLAYVLNLLSRDVSVVDLSAGAELRRIAVATGADPVPETVRRGARLFHTSNDDRIARNRKVACASCHLDGEHDGRTWDFNHLPGAPRGPRQTPSLAGLAATYGPVDPATGWGQLHRSGDRDEIQDFDHTFQGPHMGGDGFLGAGVHPELGTPNAGRDPDLDAVAAYVLSLEAVPRSPYRAADGSLNPAAKRGATFFLGTDPAKPADALCASCHVPETGFVDLKFHDVGQFVHPQEEELQNRSPPNHVNTAGLVGLWLTPPYEGTTEFTVGLDGALFDFRERPPETAPHGRLDGLTLRQLRDLETFLLSLDGNTTAAEVRGAFDDQPPRIERVAATAPTRIEVWLDESVVPASVGVSAWRLTDAGGRSVPILAADFDPQNGDRVTLTTAPMAVGCGPRVYHLEPIGPIVDLADQASGGTANVLSGGAAVPFTVDDVLTVSLGASGYEHVTVAVHDASTIPEIGVWSHGSTWLQPGEVPSIAFVRFEWRDPLVAATGLSTSTDILDARVHLRPDYGDAQTVSARRVLQAWWDHRGGDYNSNPIDPDSGHGGPTRLHSEHNVRQWNELDAGAAAPGVEGDDPGDYHGAFDVAFTPDATVAMPAINRMTTIAGPAVTEAFRFWFLHPDLDHGYALRLTDDALHDVRFHPSEQGFQDLGPVLEITYRPQPTCVLPPFFADGFESGDTSAW